MDLLAKIQDAACNQQIKLPDLLRLCKILAYRLNYNPLKIWVDHELEGYSNIEELPSYRVIKDVQLYGDFIGNHLGGFLTIQNSHVITKNVPEEFREILSTIYFKDSVAGLEKLLEVSEDGSIKIGLSAYIFRYLRNSYSNMACSEAYRAISVHCIESMLDTIKTRILDFSLEIELEIGEISSDSQNAKLKEIHTSNNVINQVFYKCIIKDKVSNYCQDKPQFAGGIVDAQTVQSNQIGGDINNTSS